VKRLDAPAELCHIHLVSVGCVCVCVYVCLPCNTVCSYVAPWAAKRAVLFRERPLSCAFYEQRCLLKQDECKPSAGWQHQTCVSNTFYPKQKKANSQHIQSGIWTKSFIFFSPSEIFDIFQTSFWNFVEFNLRINVKTKTYKNK